MCGILAIISGDTPIDEATRQAAVRMNAAMVRRGPDGQGMLVRDNVLLGHRRLAIRDRQLGHQPMQTSDGRFAVTYNGQLYNDQDLRRELGDQHQVRFRTRCDTETLLHAFRVWGADCVDRLRGMFAFVAVDFQTGEVLVARDRCGVKPLFYAELGGTFLIASSIAAILEHPQVSRRPNFRTISHYLSTFRLTLGSETLYETIHQLQPAQRMTIGRQSRRIDTYWELPPEDHTIQFEDAAEKLGSGFCDAVRSHQVSDRPVGMLLSGGIDSASIASVMAESGNRFFACGAGQEVDQASRTARDVGCEFASVASDQQSYDHAWRELLDATRLPASTPSDPVILLIAKHLKGKVDVALGGEGADEMLCGYAAQHWTGEEFLRFGRKTYQSPVDMFLASNTFLASDLKPSVLHPDVWRAAGNDEAIGLAYHRAAGDNDEDTASRKIYRLIHRVNLEGQLSRLDTATMQASLEGRVPFTDHVLCEQMARVAFANHIAPRKDCPRDHAAGQRGDARWLQTKRLLRGFAKDRLPAEIIQRPKQSFPTPVFDWLKTEWKDRLTQSLATSSFLKQLIEPGLLSMLADAPESCGLLAWPLMNLAGWGEREFAA